MRDSIPPTDTPSAPPGAETETLTRVAELLPAVVDLGERATGSEKFRELLRTLSVHCRRLLDCETARIWVARRGGARWIARDFPETPGAAPVVHRVGRGEGLAGWVVNHGKSLWLGPADPRPTLEGAVPAFHSALVVPLYRRGEIFAAIECLDRRDGVAFTRQDLDRLEQAAEHIAIALDNALLYQEAEQRALEKDVLLEISKTLLARLDLDELIDAMLQSLRQVIHYDAAAVYLVNRKTLALEKVSDVGYPEGSDEAFGLRVGVGLVGWVAKTGEAVIVPDVRRDSRYVAARSQTRSELAAPLIVGGRTIGVFNLESDHEDAYHEDHLELLSAFATQAAVAVERARLTRELLETRRLEKELAIAREIQASFLPTGAPEIPGFELAGTARPHREVGGDYYDFIQVSDTRLGLAIADVSGKGIPAALLMAGFRMSLLAEIRNEFAIRAVMRKVNSLLYESTDRNKFVTALYGVLDFKNRVLIYSNAGHNPPILLRRGGTVEYLLEGGVAFGVLPDAQYEDQPIALGVDDVLLLYTDGLSEAQSPSGEHFGQRRIEQAIVSLAGRSAAEILEGLVEAVEGWAGERGRDDDLTLMVVKALPT
ncbi:MAG TPA: SpoIIE family protein phosphatase [Candidatus Eisenbacteria bacterium]|jgi:serine phosphatase RsbU (regulator of sigma subunit)